MNLVQFALQAAARQVARLVALERLREEFRGGPPAEGL